MSIDSSLKNYLSRLVGKIIPPKIFRLATPACKFGECHRRALNPAGRTGTLRRNAWCFHSCVLFVKRIYYKRQTQIVDNKGIKGGKR